MFKKNEYLFTFCTCTCLFFKRSFQRDFAFLIALKILQLTTILFIIGLSLFFSPPSVLADKDGNSNHSTQENPLVTEDQKKLLAEDTQRLKTEFLKLFKDVSGISQEMANAIFDNISIWIDTNYSKMSLKKQQQINEFINTMIIKYQNIEELSLKTLQNIMDDYNNFLNKINSNDPNKDDVLTKKLTNYFSIS